MTVKFGIIVPTSVLLLGLILRSTESESSLKVGAVIVQGNQGNCPAESTSLRANIISEIDNLLSNLTDSLRVCECGYAGAGWRRVAFLNMTDTDQNCPGEWQLRSSPKRTCQRSVNRGCSLAAFSTAGISYSEVCGRIIGYQYGSTDALYGPIYGSTPDVASFNRSVYDGGVLITHGSVPRQHI